MVTGPGKPDRQHRQPAAATTATTADARCSWLICTTSDGHTADLTPGEAGYRAAAEQFDAEAFEARLKYQLPPSRRTAVFLAQAQQAVQDATTRRGRADPLATANLHDEIDNATRHLARPPTGQNKEDPARAAAEEQGRAELFALLDPDHASTARAEVLHSWNSHVTAQHDAERHRAEPRRADRHGAEHRPPDYGAQRSPVPGRDMPVWMRQQAARSEAAFAAGTAPPARPDDPAEIADRVARLRAHLATHHLAAHTDPGCSAARREQLNRWHDDDRTADRQSLEETVTDDDRGLDASGADAAGWPP
jgi:hypothetical protein